MKVKKLKFYKIFMMTFLFSVFFFLSSTIKATAASVDLYFPNTVVGSDYNSDGSLVLKESMYVYANTASIGKKLDNDTLRIKSVKMTVGSSSKTFSRDDDNFSSYVSYSATSESLPGANNTSGYTNLSGLDKNYVGAINLKLANMVKAVGDTSSISVIISINFEQSTKFFGMSISWKDLDVDVNYYKKATLQSSKSVTLNRTDSTLASSKLKVTDVVIDKSFYNYSDFQSSKAIYLQVSTSYKFTGKMRAYYGASSYVTLNFINSSTASVNLKNYTGFIKGNVDETEYVFNSFTLSEAKDKYGITLSSSINNNSKSASFILDTKAPTITEARVVSNGVSVLYDIGEIYTRYTIDEKSDFTFTLTGIKYNVNDDVVNVNQVLSSDPNNANSFTYSNNVSNIGEVEITGFSGVIEDEYGNKTEYTINGTSSLCKNHDSVEIVSSIKDISYNSAQSYFYGDTIDLEVTFATGLLANHFAHLDIVLSNGSVKSYDMTSQAVNEVTLSYQIVISDKVSIEYIKGYVANSEDPIYISSNLNISLNSSDLVKSVTTPYLYYYDNDTIEFTLTFSSSASKITSFSSLKLVFDAVSISISTNIMNVVQNTGSSIVTIKYQVALNHQTTTLLSIDLYRKLNATSNEEKVVSFSTDNSVIVNEYFSLGLDSTYDNPEYIDIYKGANYQNWTTDASKIISASLVFTCSRESFIDRCQYTSTADGTYRVEIGNGFITFENGRRSNVTRFDVIVNVRAPIVEFVDRNVTTYNDKNYYKNQTDVLTYTLIDAMGDKCLYYNFDGSATFNMICENEPISFPLSEGEYTLYYYTSDGINESSISEYEYPFIYRPQFEIGDIEIKVNDTLVNDSLTKVNGNYNYIDIEYSGAKELDLLSKFEVFVTAKGTITSSSSLNNDTFSLSKLDLPSISENVNIQIKLTDTLGNITTYSFVIFIDTIDPVFDNIQVTTSKGNENYVVVISGHDDNDIYVKINGNRVNLDANSSFVTEEEEYVVVLTDLAGNTSEKVFTTINPSVELFDISIGSNVEYEINITPFNSFHKIDSYRYLVFDYLKQISVNDINNAMINVCTLGRKVNCYVNGNFDAYSNVIYQTFNKGYSYVLLIKVNNILINQKYTENLPRLDIAPADVTKPIISVLDDDTNPDYISSVSGRKFVFRFNAQDEHLTGKYLYMIAETKINESTLSQPSNFYEYYSRCYLDDSSNGCGIVGENIYSGVVSGKDNTYLGEIIIKSDHNTARRLKNNTVYNLYVLLQDESGNASVYKIRNFENIIVPSTIEYLSDELVYTGILNGNSVVTANTTRIRITPYKNIKVETVKINNEVKSCDAISGCSYDLRTGKHVIEVVDELGNNSVVTVYSATANNPIIDVYYLYNEEYFKLLDSDLSYNSGNINKVYIKAINNNLKAIEVAMNTTSRYVAGDIIFDSISDDNSVYGMSLSDLMSAHGEESYSSTITITVINDNDAFSVVTLKVDNVNPDITSVAPDTKIDLLGNQYTLNYSDGKYSLSYNYQRDITYSYLFKAMNLKIDGVAFDEMKNINRLKMKVNQEIYDGYNTSINKGIKNIEINYFDVAGNVATTYVLELRVIDGEAPSISLNNAIEIAELNVLYKLAQVNISDNHDEYASLVLVVSIDGEVIDYTNYKFSEIGEYEVTYKVIDTSSNCKEIVQTVVVKDTNAPVLKEGTIKNYEVSLKEKIDIAMPIFVDQDGKNTEYLPYQITLINPTGNIMDSTSATYPLVIDGNVIKLEFVDGLQTGTYKIKFIAHDSSNNAVEEYFNIVVKDSVAPVLEVSINGKYIETNSIYNYPLGHYLEVSVVARDNNDGDLSNLVESNITFNGNKVNKLDTSISGTYIVVFTVSDYSENESEFKVTIIINKDTTVPVINKVVVNGVELVEGINNKINGTMLEVNIDAYDEFEDIECKAIINDVFAIDNNSSISIESGLSGESYTIEIIVRDSSLNETKKYYTILIDNTSPLIMGVTNDSINYGSVSLEFYDDHITNIDIYRNSYGIDTITYNVSGYRISNSGVYEIIARDSYGNESRTHFVIKGDKTFNIIDDNGSSSVHTFNYSGLIEVIVEENNLKFQLNHKDKINNNDQIYILLSYPNSEYKYVVASLNGESYLSKDSISIERITIGDVESEKMLEKFGDRHYAYIMVVNDKAIVDDQSNEPSAFIKVLKTVGSIVFIISLLGAILWLIIKLRRRIRAA